MRRAIAVDLFAGAGGMTLGFEQAGFDVLAAVEIDPIHCATHEFNFPFWRVLCRDITKITGQEIRENSDIKNQEIAVVFGGPPCQGFSMMGKRLLDDPRNSLVFHFIRLIDELNPQYFVMENVKGMTQGQHRKFLEEIIQEFQNIGYQIVENYQVLNAANFGIPQHRERLFMLGCRQGLPLPKYPQKRTQAPHSRKKHLDLPSCPTVADAISDLPEIEKYEVLKQTDCVKASFKKATSSYARYLRGLTILEDDYSYRRHYPRQILTSSLRTHHSELSIQRFKETLPGKLEPISHFHKLDFQGICNTLRAGTPRNRGSFTSPRPIHPQIPRCITVREAARLHSFPDWFRFHVTKWHGFRQVGNSVPPLLAKAVAAEILKALQWEPEKPKKSYHLGSEKLLNYTLSQAAEFYQTDLESLGFQKRNLQALKAQIQRVVESERVLIEL